MTSPAKTAPLATTRWDVVAIAVAAGVFGALQIGKAPPVIPDLRAELDLTLQQAGWVASLFNLASALGGAVFGAFADRIGMRRTVIASIAVIVAGSLWGAFAADGATLMLSRALESFGFVGVVVAAPKLIAASTRARDRNFAFGVWAAYMPFGMAAALFAAPAVLAAADWRAMWLASAGLGVLLIAATLWLTGPARWRAPPEPPPQPVLRNLALVVRRPGSWLLALCFALYSVQFFSVLSWLPTFLIATQGRSQAEAALMGAAAVAVNIVGALACGWLLGRGVARAPLVILTYLVMMVCAAGVFGPWAPAEAKLPLAMLFSMMGGVIPAALLAAAPDHAPRPDLVGTVSGVIVQGANTGSLLGPPVMAVTVAAFGGWQDSWVLNVACGTAGCLAAAALWRVEVGMRADATTAQKPGA